MWRTTLAVLLLPTPPVTAQTAIEKLVNGADNTLVSQRAEAAARIKADRQRKNATEERKRQQAAKQIRDENEKKAEEERLRQSTSGESPPALHRACATNNIDEIKALIAKGANVSEHDPENGWTPLHYAVNSGSLDAVRLLLANKASVNLGTGSAGFRPLHIAVFQHNPEMIQLLLNNGADPNATSQGDLTSLMYAADDGDKDAVCLLLANGALPLVKDSLGVSALDFVAIETWQASKANLDKAKAQVQRPNITGERCPYCDGTGRKSAALMQRLTSAAAANNVGAGTITTIDPNCTHCGGAGYLLSAADQGKIDAYNKQVLAIQAKLDQPVIQSYEPTVAALNAFGEGDNEQLKQQIIAGYKGMNWKPPAPTLEKPLQSTVSTVASGSIQEDKRSGTDKFKEVVGKWHIDDDWEIQISSDGRNYTLLENWKKKAKQSSEWKIIGSYLVFRWDQDVFAVEPTSAQSINVHQFHRVADKVFRDGLSLGDHADADAKGVRIPSTGTVTDVLQTPSSKESVSGSTSGTAPSPASMGQSKDREAAVPVPIRATEVVIPATAGIGSTQVSLGPLKKGQVMMFQYVKGEWSAWHGDPAGSPDDLTVKNANVLRVTICEKQEDSATRIADIPGGTASKPFEFKADHDIAELFLNMQDKKPKDNHGEVVYKFGRQN